MNVQTPKSPMSVQHSVDHGTIPYGVSSNGILKVSSITRNRDSFTCGKLDLGVLDLSTDCRGGAKLEDGARCVRFASAAKAIESMLSPTPATKAENVVPQQPVTQQAALHKAVMHKAIPQKKMAPPVEASQKIEGQEVTSIPSREEESVSSLRVRSLIELFENESIASSVDGIRDSVKVFVTETPARPVRELVAMFDKNSNPSVNFVETNPDKCSPKHGSMEYHRKEPIRSFLEVEYAETEVISETEVERVDSRDIVTNMNITPLNTQEIDDAGEDIGINCRESQKSGRVRPFTNPFRPLKKIFAALKTLRSRRARNVNSSDCSQSGPANVADSDASPRDPPGMGSGEERKSPNIFRQIARIMQFLPRKAKKARAE